MYRTARHLTALQSLTFVVFAGWVPLACSASDENPSATGGASSGGAPVTGGIGTVATGGVISTGGTLTTPTGGSAQTGGAPVSTGGSPSTPTGGTPNNTGGASTGGTSQTGGASTGGIPNTGGTTANGGTANGGSTTGGSAGKGGTSTGGNANGGAGGAGTGGSTGGKSSTGGTSTGGTSTGGSAGAGNTALCPPGITQTLTVAKDGSGQFSTVQAAVNSIASGSSARIRIDIKAGTYTEKLTIASRTNLCLVGAGANTILTYNDSNGSVGSTSGSASVLISANDFSAANLTIQNSFGSGSQAVALRTTGQRQQFLNCRFVGYQDTLYTHQGTQYFRNCYVQGNTDYVFGGATAVLENCEVRNVEGGSAVAAPNTDIGAAYGIVFLGGKFTAASGVKANSVGLGRPWGANGAGAYLRVDLGAHIIAAGFVEMSGNQPQNARFKEYQSTGTGANSGSRSSYQLSASQAANYTVATILSGWTPSYSQ
jgi:pectin methylesterase-like acyl-CoA thioesterase